MDSSMFNGFGRGLLIGAIALLIIGGIAGVAFWKSIAWIIQHLEVTWK